MYELNFELVIFKHSILSFLYFLSVFAVVPHITDAIQEWVMKQAKISVDGDDVEPQVCVIEVNWTYYLSVSTFTRTLNYTAVKARNRLFVLNRNNSK